MKIFISHAALDHELAVALSDLLDLGAGVSHDDVFCSSAKGSIPNGTHFVDHILQKLNEADLIVALLSKSYFKSKFCLAEAGAALTRQRAGNAKFYSFVVPPVAFSELEGALYGIQSGSLLDRSELGGLREIVTENVTSRPKDPTWDEKRDAFLKVASATVIRYETEDLASRIVVQNLISERSENATYKFKLRIVLRNDARESCEVRNSTWLCGPDDVPLFLPLQFLPWQVKTHNSWEPSPHGESILHIPSGRAFRTWIGVAEAVNEAELLKRVATRKLGDLILPLKFAGQEIIESIRL
jgi:hypothetical protein